MGLGELGDKPETISLRGGGLDVSHSSSLNGFMKWFPVGIVRKQHQGSLAR